MSQHVSEEIQPIETSDQVAQLQQQVEQMQDHFKRSQNERQPGSDAYRSAYRQLNKICEAWQKFNDTHAQKDKPPQSYNNRIIGLEQLKAMRDSWYAQFDGYIGDSEQVLKPVNRKRKVDEVQ